MNYWFKWGQSFLSMNILPVVVEFFGLQLRLHCGSPFGPAWGTNLSILGVELEGLEQSQVFRNIPSNSQIVDTGMPENLVVIDQESTSEGNSSIVQNSIVWSNFFLYISQEGNIKGAQSSSISWFESPFAMDKVGVNRTANNLASAVSELLGMVAEVNNFCGADESKVEGVEEEKQPFRFIVV